MSQTKPPGWADKLLVRLCPQDLLEEIQGDLHEAFYWRCEERSLAYAKRKFLLEVLLVSRFYKPKIMKNSKLALLNNYLKTALRFLWKTRKFSAINIFGLVIGIVTCWMCFFYLYDEISYDQFNKNKDRIFRITQEVNVRGNLLKMSGASYKMGEQFPEHIPHIESMSRFKSAFGILNMGDESIFQSMHFADPGLFKMIDFKLLEGNYLNFGSPDNILISASLATKMQVDLEEVSVIYQNEDKRFNVIGIFQDLPHNSTIRPDMILPFAYYAARSDEAELKEWYNLNMNALIMLKDKTHKSLVEEQMTELVNGQSNEENEDKFTLQPYSEIHLDTTYRNGNGLQATADIDILWIAGVVGLLCLLISAINYSNFSIGNYLVRAKEVAVRKVVGAHQQSVFIQFIFESIINTSIAAVLSILVLFFTLPFFTEFMDKSYLNAMDLFTSDLFLGAMGVIVFIALVAGLYPALVLSGFKVNAALKGKQKLGKGNFLSKMYLSLQFSLAIFLIIGMLAANKQFDYLIDFDLGYEDEKVIQLNIPRNDESQLARFENKLQSIPAIKTFAPNSSYNGTDFVYEDVRFDTKHIVVTDQFIPTLGIKMTQGRNFDPKLTTDMTHGALVNESFVKMLGLTNPVGTEIPFSYGNFENPTIIGVVEDFHFYSPKYEKMPLIMYQSRQYQLQTMLIKLDDAATSDVLYQIDKAWKSEYAPYPIELEWLADYNADQMAVEKRVKKIATTGSMIAIFLAALGLLSLVGTYINQRMKEISIRKVSGATAVNLYVLYMKKFAAWIVVGFFAGCLPAYYFVYRWLENYPSKIALNWTFAFAALFICVVVFVVTTISQISKVARINPVVYLRDE